MSSHQLIDLSQGDLSHDDDDAGHAKAHDAGYAKAEKEDDTAHDAGHAKATRQTSYTTHPEPIENAIPCTHCSQTWPFALEWT
jgi:hypothetical protein